MAEGVFGSSQLRLIATKEPEFLQNINTQSQKCCRLFLPLNTPCGLSACVTQGKVSGSELLRPFVSHREVQQSVAEWIPLRVPAVLHLSVGGSQSGSPANI